MSQEYDDDLRRAALYLGMDEKELANVRAEHAKYERRKAAMQRGDQGSPIPGAECECGPLTFAPIKCSGCDILLTRQNHGNGRQCERCFSESQALRKYEIARQHYLESKKPTLFRRFLSLFSRGRGRK